MSGFITRAGKGSALTDAELDRNWLIADSFSPVLVAESTVDQNIVGTNTPVNVAVPTVVYNDVEFATINGAGTIVTYNQIKKYFGSFRFHMMGLNGQLNQMAMLVQSRISPVAPWVNIGDPIPFSVESENVAITQYVNINFYPSVVGEQFQILMAVFTTDIGFGFSGSYGGLLKAVNLDPQLSGWGTIPSARVEIFVDNEDGQP